MTPISPRQAGRRPGVRVTLATLLGLVAGSTSGCFAAAQEGAGPGSGAGGTLRLALPWAPAAAYSPYSDDGVLLSRLGATESLTRLDESGAPAPVLAESWEQVDARTWRFELRPGVAFQDGTTLTAEDVVRSLDAAAAATPVPSEISSVELTTTAVDEDTVEIVTSVADPVLPQRLSSPNLPVLAAAAFDGKDVEAARHGTGPFAVTATRGAQGATLEAHDAYWDGEPALDGLEVRYTPDAAARVAAFEAGEVDVAHTVAAADVAGLGGELLEMPLPRSVLVYLNSNREALDEPGERAFVADAVDQELLAGTVFEDHADPATGLFGPATPWAQSRPALPEPEASVKPDETVRIATYTERPELAPVADAVAAELREAGVEVEQVVRPYTGLEPALLAGEFDVVVGSRSYAVDTGEPVDYLLSDFGCRGSYNLAHLCDRDVEKVLEDLQGQPDIESRREAVLAAEHAVLATGAVVPVVHERARHAVSDSVSGLATDPFERLLVTAGTSLR
ncbi:ABC transporter substrate-binding protein [Nocardioides sp. GCM10027113]|uniref:ABC transporter substrate-binding protein n=1 Tax=unclassified Nocardioides TaxID=2615069 RepID=UPI003623EFEF